MSIEDGKCPQCGELLVYPRNDIPYCEDCGWPDEDFGIQKIHTSYDERGELVIKTRKKHPLDKPKKGREIYGTIKI